MRRLGGLAAVTLALWVGPASAQSVYTGVQPPSAGAVDAGVSGSGGLAGGSGSVPGASGQLRVGPSAQPAEVNQGRLAITGTDVMSLVAVGSGAIVLGALLKRRADA
jgi:hypothetical protein